MTTTFPDTATDTLRAAAAAVHGSHRVDAYLSQLTAAHPEPDQARIAVWRDTLERQRLSGLPTAVVFDLDGTLLDSRPARLHLTGEFRDLDAYHRATDVAPVIAAAAAVHEACLRLGHKVLLFTARRISERRRSETWLETNGLHVDQFFMRGMGDNRDDYRLKQNMYFAAVRQFNVLHALDDNPEVLRMWADLGVSATAMPNCSYGYDDGMNAPQGDLTVDNPFA